MLHKTTADLTSRPNNLGAGNQQRASNASAMRDPWHWFWLGVIGAGYAATVVLTALLISWVWP